MSNRGNNKVPLVAIYSKKKNLEKTPQKNTNSGKFTLTKQPTVKVIMEGRSQGIITIQEAIRRRSKTLI
jgi:hypothetical protein